MRLLHTADWHLGRVFHRVDLIDDQRHVLDQLIAIIERKRPDLLVIAGDVYDRAVPPAAAMQLLDDVLVRIVVDLGVVTVVVAGNHDSMERLGFGARLMAANALHVFGPVAAEPRPIELHDEHGPIEIHALPYPEPAAVRERLADPSIRDHDAAMRAMVDRARASGRPGVRRVLVTHAAVEGGRTSESERPLAIGRRETVGRERFSGFDYVALGHLHRPQAVEPGRIHYCGSILPYSFSEVSDKKGVVCVDIGARTVERVEAIPLEPRRRLRVIEGTLAEVLAGAEDDERRDDYLRVRLVDRGPLLETVARLREVYPHVLEVDRPFLTEAVERTPGAPPVRERGDIEQFAAFFEQVCGESLSGELRDELVAIVERLASEREEGSM